ncbi:Hypothetical predicted protein, partial [Olea europaea subsp. europaea]
MSMQTTVNPNFNGNLDFLKSRILVGNDIKNKKYSLAAFLGDKGMGQLDNKDLEVDLASYVAEVNLEETVAKTVGIEKRILHSGWDSKDLCRDEEM